MDKVLKEMLRKSVNKYELLNDKDALIEASIIMKTIIDIIIDEGGD
jgi:hypothetical protein